jgi:hypothetical protein
MKRLHRLNQSMVLNPTKQTKGAKINPLAKCPVCQKIGETHTVFGRGKRLYRNIHYTKGIRGWCAGSGMEIV